MTLETLISLAAKRLGHVKALLEEIGISRQRLSSASRGGPPLHPNRLVHLAVIAEIDPLEALRAGGRSELARLLERGFSATSGLSARERAIVLAYRRLSRSDQRAFKRWLETRAYPARPSPWPQASSKRREHERTQTFPEVSSKTGGWRWLMKAILLTSPRKRTTDDADERPVRGPPTAGS